MEDFEDENNPWLSFSDLLAGVMLVFCIICVDFIQKLDKTNNTKAAVFAKISKELKQAGINPKVNPENGTVEISSNIVFDTNSSKLKIDGIDYLSKIVPILSRSIFTVPGAEELIVSIDIVGYSSQKIRDDKFMNDMMSLSVQRSNSVWSYVLLNNTIDYHEKLLKKLKVSGWGNIQADTLIDLETDRKVVFQLQFINPIENNPKVAGIKEEVESVK